MIDRIDHFVVTVADVLATCDFYRKTLGMEVLTFGDGRKALGFGEQKMNLHQKGYEFEPKATQATAGSGDFCPTTTTPLDRVVARLGGRRCRRGAWSRRTHGRARNCARSNSATPTATSLR